MNLMESSDLLPVAGWIGTALLHFLWQGTLLAALLAMVLLLLKRSAANVRYAVACGTLPLMSACPIVTSLALQRRAPAKPISQLAPLPSVLRAPNPTIPEPLTPSALSATTPDDKGATARSEYRPLNWIPACSFAIWLAGVVLLSIRLLGGWLMVQRLVRRSSRPIIGPLSVAANTLADRLAISRLPRLLVCDGVAVPTLIGGLRSAILLPTSVVTGVSAQILEALLAHELCHLKRHDYFVNLWQCAVETALFYHPAVWWVSGVIRREHEFCCDDMAIALLNDRTTYANALATMEELRSRPLVLAASDGDLLARIRRIASPDSRRLASMPATLVALALPIAVVAIVVAAGIKLAAPATASARRFDAAVDRRTAAGSGATSRSKASQSESEPNRRADADGLSNSIGESTGSSSLFAVDPGQGSKPGILGEIPVLSQASGALLTSILPQNRLNRLNADIEVARTGEAASRSAVPSPVAVQAPIGSADAGAVFNLARSSDLRLSQADGPAFTGLKRGMPETAISPPIRAERIQAETGGAGSTLTAPEAVGANQPTPNSRDSRPADSSKSAAAFDRTIGEIVVVGNKVLNTAAILALSAHKVGDPCTPEVLAEMQKRLARTGYFGMHHPDNAAKWVQIQAEDLPDNKCRVTITVDENESITGITIMGSGPVKPEEVKALITKTAVFNVAQFVQDHQRIQDLYRNRGYSLEFGAGAGMDPAAPGVLIIPITITRVEDIVVMKESVKTADPRLLSQIATKAGGYFNRRTFYEVDRSVLLKQYRRTDITLTEAPAGPGKVHLTISMRRLKKGEN